VIVEIVDALLEILSDRVGRLEVGIVQGGFLQNEKPRLDEVEPRGIGRSPENLDVRRPCHPQIERSLVSAEVIPNDIDLGGCSKTWQDCFLQKCEHDLASFGGTGNSDSVARVMRKRRQKLNRIGWMIAIWSAPGFLSPCPASPRDTRQRPHFVHAHDDSVFRRIAI
jgi:hypothetical protein